MQRTNETAGSGLYYVTESFYVESLKTICANVSIHHAVSLIKNATKPTAKHENWHTEQEYFMEKFYPIVDEVINSHLFISIDERWTFILEIYKLVHYDYKMYNVSKMLFEYLQAQNFTNACELKKMLDKLEFNKEQLIENSKSKKGNNYYNDDYNDSRSHWDEYDEDGIPYTDYEFFGKR